MSRRNFLHCQFPYGGDNVKFAIDDQYDALSIINGGGQGHIIKAYDVNNQQIVAVKKIKESTNPDNMKRVYREFVISKIIQHRNLITLLDAFAEENGNDLYLVYEYMDASMFDLMHLPMTDSKNFRHMVWDSNDGDYFTADILFQMFCGLRYLHQDKLKFIHRDIKPDNILLKQLGTGYWLLKICDLGLARQLKEKEQEQVDLTNYVVTWPYRAPEVMISDSYTFAIDLWSVGCILAEMITGELLFKREDRRDQIFRILLFTGFPEGTKFFSYIQSEINKAPELYGPSRVYEYFSDNKLPNWTKQRISKQFIRDLLKNLLEFNPSDRLTAEQGSELPHFNFLQNRIGINDIAPEPYNPNVITWPKTESGWRTLIKKELDDYEAKRFGN